MLAPQGNDTAKRLAADDRAGAVPKELYSHYTIISSDASGGYSQAAYAEYFPEEIGAIVAIFDDWIAGKSLPLCPSSSAVHTTVTLHASGGIRLLL